MKRFSVGIMTMASNKKVLLPTLAFLTGALVAGLVGLNGAVSDASAAAPAAAPPAASGLNPAMIARQREFDAQFGVCEQCHGDDGIPNSPHTPIVAGQRIDYLERQIHDFATGTRKSEIMSWMVETLETDEHARAAAIFANRPWPKKTSTEPVPAAPAQVVACRACHGPDFAGTKRPDGTIAPRLAGQKYDYLVESMAHFANGERPNTANMGSLMKGLSPEARDTLARYLSNL